MYTYTCVHICTYVCIHIKSELPGIVCHFFQIIFDLPFGFPINNIISQTHVQTLMHVHIHKHTHTHTTYTHAYVARSLSHTHTHARTHTTPHHAALFACHAVAPAASVVVLSREVQTQALRCSRARVPTKTQGKTGRFTGLAYTMH